MENFKLDPPARKTRVQYVLAGAKGLMLLLQNHYFYVGIAMLITGIQLNYLAQEYLHNYINEGKWSHKFK